MIEEAGRWADRISINVELPRQQDLNQLAPEKNIARIEGAMTGIRARIEQSKAERKESKKAPIFAPAGQSTQMIVGATDASDAAILDQASSMYTRHRLRRVYYSAFSPIPDASSKLPIIAPPLIREHRLYQADWLIRFYGFKAGEIVNAAQPDLDLNVDPKLAWALQNPAQFPVNLNSAPRETLLRVPGLGVKNVDRILKIRRWHRLTTDDLARLRVPLKKTLPFVETADHRPKIIGEIALTKPRQMDLFTPAAR